MARLTATAWRVPRKYSTDIAHYIYIYMNGSRRFRFVMRTAAFAPSQVEHSIVPECAVWISLHSWVHSNFLARIAKIVLVSSTSEQYQKYFKYKSVLASPFASALSLFSLSLSLLLRWLKSSFMALKAHWTWKDTRCASPSPFAMVFFYQHSSAEVSSGQ